MKKTTEKAIESCWSLTEEQLVNHNLGLSPNLNKLIIRAIQSLRGFEHKRTKVSQEIWNIVNEHPTSMSEQNMEVHHYISFTSSLQDVKRNIKWHQK